MVIGISPTIDYAFKLLFGGPEHVRVTIHFLNALLGHILRIGQISIENPILRKDGKDDKLSVLDILATDEHGRKLNIEMQTTLPAGLSKRLAFYTASLYSNQLSEGERYTSLCPAISICVLTQPIFPKSNELYLEFQLRSPSGLLLTDDLQIHLLQLPKLKVELDNLSKASPPEQWAYFMLHAHELTVVEVKRLFADPIFAEAAEILEMVSKTPEQKMKYDARVKFQRDEAAKMEFARSEGRAEGRAEALSEGIEKGALLGRISLLQELLGLSGPSRAELSGYGEEQLVSLEKSLRLQLATRGQ